MNDESHDLGFGAFNSGRSAGVERNESHDLGDRLRRLATWADAVPEPHRRLAAVYVDRLAVALARLVGEHADDPLVAALTTEVEQ